jgi:hypothetical protein
VIGFQEAIFLTKVRRVPVLVAADLSETVNFRIQFSTAIELGPK